MNLEVLTVFCQYWPLPLRLRFGSRGFDLPGQVNADLGPKEKAGSKGIATALSKLLIVTARVAKREGDELHVPHSGGSFRLTRS